VSRSSRQLSSVCTEDHLCTQKVYLLFPQNIYICLFCVHRRYSFCVHRNISSVYTEDISSVYTEDTSSSYIFSSANTEDMSSVYTEDISSVYKEDIVYAEDISSVSTEDIYIYIYIATAHTEEKSSVYTEDISSVYRGSRNQCQEVRRRWQQLHASTKATCEHGLSHPRKQSGNGFSSRGIRPLGAMGSGPG